MAVASLLASSFRHHIPYTKSANICLAVNPYKWLPLYGSECSSSYMAPQRPLPPHVFAVAAAAFSAMCESNRNQSVLVSGESGAGKTGTAAVCPRPYSCCTHRRVSASARVLTGATCHACTQKRQRSC